MSASNRGDCSQGTPCRQRMNQTAMPFPPTQQYYCRSPAGFPRLIAWYRSACAASLSPAGAGNQALPLAGPTFRKVAACLSRHSSPEQLGAILQLQEMLIRLLLLEFVRSCSGARPSYVEKAMRIVIASLSAAMALRFATAVGIMPAAAHTFTEFILPTPASRPSAITTGPDGALWFIESGGKIGRITTQGDITEFPIK